MTMEIQRGTFLTCATAGGGRVIMRALSSVEQGLDFPVVWVCIPEEYEHTEATEGGPHGIPWPLTAVQVAEGVESNAAKAAG